MSTFLAKSAAAAAHEKADATSKLVKDLYAEAYALGARHQRELGLAGLAQSVVEGAAPIPGDLTVGEARAHLTAHLDEGAECPVCLQMAKVRRRLMSSTVVRGLAALYRTHGRGAGHMPTLAREQLSDIAHQGGYLTLAQHWGLMIDERAVRSDGGRAGWWRVTDTGEQFLRGELAVPRYALLYNGGCIQVTGEPITAKAALGEHFDYALVTAPAGIPAGVDLDDRLFLPAAA